MATNRTARRHTVVLQRRPPGRQQRAQVARAEGGTRRRPDPVEQKRMSLLKMRQKNRTANQAGGSQ
jgi:hypothetical protein